MSRIFSTIKDTARSSCSVFSLKILMLCNRMRTSALYIIVAPAHRTYRSYLMRMVQSKGFAYALIILPVSSLGTSLSLPTDLSLATISANESYAVSQDAPVKYSDARLTLTKEISFTFESPANQEVVATTVYPDHSVSTTWNDDGHTLTVAPTDSWTPGTHYTIALTLNSDPDSPAKLYQFRSDGYPQILTQNPERDAKDFVVENGKSFDIALDRSIEDLDFRILGRDLLPLEQEILIPERTIRATIRGVAQESKEMEFIVYAKHKELSNDHFYPIGSAVFDARIPQPTSWPEEIAERTTLSLERTIPKVTEGKYIDIDLGARLTTLFEDGVAVLSFVNSPGAADTPTLTGEFKVENKGIKPLSRSFGVYLPYWLAFTPDGLYGIHDLVEWPAGHPDFPNSPEGGKESVASIDSAVSPGCVRHTTENSAELYAWADVGIPVIIY